MAPDPIDLDRIDVAGALDQRARQRGLAGADFDDRLAGPGINRIDNARNDARIVQEVLAEAFACPVSD